MGGVEFAVRDLAERLAGKYSDAVTVLTTDAFTNENFRDPNLPRIPISPDEVQGGVRVRRFPVVTHWAPALRVAQGIAWRARLPGNDRLRTWYQGPLSPGLRAAAAHAAADVVVAASFPLNHLHYAFARAPVVLLGSIHPWDPWGYERPNLLRLTRRAAATVAHTPSEERWFLERGAPAERLHVIPEGIDPPAAAPGRGAFRQRHGIPPGDFMAAYVGQQGSHKGLDVLLAALPRLPGRLVVAGAPTPYSPVLRRLTAELDPETRARLVLLNAVSEEEKAELLTDADVFVSLSRHESFGITTLEAWAHSLPVVVGDGPAQRDLLEEGALGRLVPYGDRDLVVSALSDLAAAPEERRRLGEAGHARLLERYTLDRVVAQYRALLEAVATHT